MIPRSRRAAPLALALAGALLLAGCVGGSKWVTSTQPDHFRLDLASAGRGTEKEWDWQTEGGRLRVSAALNASGGSARLTLTDPAGRDVFDATLRPDDPERDVTLEDAAAGTYRVSVRTEDVRGAFVVRLDRADG